MRHGAGHQNQPETENPIAHRLRPAGSGFQDFRTPAGIRNSSGKRPVRYRAVIAKSSRSFINSSRACGSSVIPKLA
jgi:hypothetical protein